MIASREIPKHVGDSFAQRYNITKFIETSAKESENVEHIFQYIAEQLTKQAREQSTSYYSRIDRNIDINNNNNSNSNGKLSTCCSSSA